jgi:hypothetical protein
MNGNTIYSGDNCYAEAGSRWIKVMKNYLRYDAQAVDGINGEKSPGEIR